MSYFRVCPYCGSHLDACETCDCKKEEAPASAANTDRGGVEQIDTADSASHDTRE